MQNIYRYLRSELEAAFVDCGVAPVHARVLFAGLYRRSEALDEVARTSGLPQDFAQLISSQWLGSLPAVAETSHSDLDRSVKFLMQLRDDRHVETVLIPEKQRVTLCLSSQVGCAQACTFCSTGRMGLIRNLTADEIVGQVVLANRWLKSHPEWLEEHGYALGSGVTNVVFMGMGEPLDNVPEVARAIRILTDSAGLGLAPKRVTVSTAGHLDGLKEFAAERLGVSLAFSLHATTQAKRSQIMPINRRFPLDDLLEAMRAYTVSSKKAVFVQYTMLAGINDGQDDAARLSALLKPFNAKVNLIPFNGIDHSRFQAPSDLRLQEFRSVLAQNGIMAIVRFSKGRDINAACGQLIRKANF